MMIKYIPFVIIISSLSHADARPYSYGQALVDGVNNGIELGLQMREMRAQEALIEQQILLMEQQRRLLEIEEEKLTNNSNENKYNIPRKISAAATIVGSIEQLSQKINVPLHKVLNWRNGHEIPDPWSCKRIEQATNGYVKAQDILPDYPWEELR